MKGLVPASLALLVFNACDVPREEEPVAAAEQVRSYIHAEPGPYEGVPTTVYEDTVPSCASCEVRLVPVGRFGSLDDPVLLRDRPLPERDGRGRFYATVPGAHDHEIVVYEPDGTTVRTVGAVGEGPGEFRRFKSNAVVGPGDSLYVAHDGFLISVFDSAGVFARRFQVEHDLSTAHLGHASSQEILVKTGLGLHPALRSSGVHRYDHEGRHRGGIGPPGVMVMASDPERGPPRPSQRSFAVSPSLEGRIWIIENGNYRIEEIGPDGAVERILGVRGPPRWNTRLIMSVEEYLDPDPPPTYPSSPRPMHRLRVRGITELAPDLLAVTIEVPSDDWESVELRRDDRFPDDRFAAQSVQQMLQTVVDVIHVPTGAVLARTAYPGTSYMSSDGTLFRIHFTELGVVQVEAFEIELEGFDGT